MAIILVVGWSSQILLGLIFALAAKGGFLRKYVAFYLFVASLFMISLVRFYFYTQNPLYPNYHLVYWYTQFLIVAGGYGLIRGIYGHIFSPFPGTAKVARTGVSSV